MASDSISTPAAVALLLGLGVASGCQPSCEELAEAGPWVEVGTGEEEDEFQAVEDGDVLTAAWGSQGGQHIWGGARAGNVHFGALPGPMGPADNNPRVGFTIGDDDGVIASTSPSVTAFTRAGGEGSTAEISIFVEVSPWDTAWLFPDDYDPNGENTWEEEQAAWEAAIADLEARDLVMRVTLEDSCGSELVDERTIRVTGVAGY